MPLTSDRNVYIAFSRYFYFIREGDYEQETSSEATNQLLCKVP